MNITESTTWFKKVDPHETALRELGTLLAHAIGVPHAVFVTGTLYLAGTA